MNSLECINKQILLVKEQIQYLDGIFDGLSDDTKEFFESGTGLKELKKELKTLEQIKAELEAWEKDWNHHLTKDQYQKLKKALEVKDD